MTVVIWAAIGGFIGGFLVWFPLGIWSIARHDPAAVKSILATHEPDSVSTALAKLRAQRTQKSPGGRAG